MSPLQILAISGSLRAGSYNTALLRAVSERAPDGLKIEIVTPKGVPIYDGDDETATGIPRPAQELIGSIRSAQGIIICTPEYNFSIPGGLKNLIDWVSRDKQQPFKRKPVGVMGASTGAVGTARSQYHLRQTLQALEVITMPRPELFAGNSRSKFDGALKLIDQATMDLITRWLKAYEEWVRKMA
jgi:chromate reductase